MGSSRAARARGQVAEQHADQRGTEEGRQHGTEREDHLPLLHKQGEQEADAIGQQHADQTADQAHQHGLGQELLQHVALARAHRHADADLARALGHRHQHDVHHADAAHHQEITAISDSSRVSDWLVRSAVFMMLSMLKVKKSSPP